MKFKLPFNSIILVDGNNLMHRNFHANSDLMTSTGIYTGGVFGTINSIKTINEQLKPLYIIFCFDFKRQSFRNDLYPEYKGNRLETDPTLKPQFELIEEFCTVSKIPFIKKEGVEADDLLGSLACKAANLGYEPFVLTGDRDSFQLVNDKIKVIYVSTKEGLVLYDTEKVKERYNGLTPEQLKDLKGLQGDTSDNIPGVKNIGEKKATSLLTQYKTLEGVYENIENITGKMKENLINDKEKAFLSRTLGTIVCDIDVELDLNFNFSLDYPEVRKFLDKLEIKSI